MGNTINTKLIIEFISNNNLTKHKFCKECKISYYILKKMLSNNLHFRITSLFRIAKFMNIQVYKLFI